jgi:hypothetical protein
MRRKKIPNTPIEYSRVRPSWKNILSKKALYKYTTTWNKNIRSLSGEFPIDETTRKRAQLYKKYIIREFKRQNYPTPLYRGITGLNKKYFNNAKNYVNKPSFSSFTKNYSVAKRFSNTNGYILVLNNPKNIMSINYRNYPTMAASEKEVLLPAGRFIIKKKNLPFIYINFRNTRV